MEKVTIKIDGKDYQAEEGDTILKIAHKNGIKIPSLCFHPDAKARSNCRMCVVEIKGNKNLQTSCSTKVTEGMEIITDSGRIKRARKINLELIFSQHQEECDDCVSLDSCRLLKYQKEFGAEINKFPDRKKNRKIVQTGPIVFDWTKCIDCRLCADVCPVEFLEVENRGADIAIEASSDEKKECINCGQCIVHCPVGAIEAEGEFEEIEKPLADKSKTVIIQFAPAIRSSIGEEFGMEAGSIVTDQMVAGMKKLGFSKVFDTSVAADFTTYEEAQELLERVKTGKNLPAFSSCCPAWVKFLEFYYPEFIHNLCTSRSPQIMMGGILKTYWAKENNVDPKDIIVVSVMPCTAKKFEVKREEMKLENGCFPVDYVLTTREMARLFKKHNIDLKNIEPEKADNPFGDPSGAGVIYGASGGVFESAFRTAYFMATGKNMENVDVKEIRGLEGIKIKELKLGDTILKVAVVSGIKNAQKMLEELKKNPSAFHAMEVMACPGGCIGGGGQPIPNTPEIRKKRAQALYQVDAEKKMRLAHENPSVLEAYEKHFTDKEIIHKVLHTSYQQRKKSEVKELKSSRGD
ncbi:MAG: [FeFe] hydrogenase, group A [Parcubacteria group bacterium]|jgi:iron-only hydrogenase group A